MDSDDGLNDDGPFSRWLPPDDRLWRHPSEMADIGAHRSPAVALAGRVTGRVWTIALLAGLVGALVATGIGSATGEFAHTTTVVQPVTRMVSPDTVDTLGTSSPAAAPPNWTTIYNALAPSLVTITAEAQDGETTAAGVIWRSDGLNSYILTNDVLSGATSVRVTFGDGSSPVTGKLIGGDPLTGVAVVEVPGGNRTSATMGTLADIQVGTQVADIEPPSASTTGAGPVSAGLVSGIDREVNVSGGPTMFGMIGLTGPDQAPGGTAVVEADGAVVGLSAAVQSTDTDAVGATFALPIDVAERVATQLVDGRPPTHPWIGVIEAESLLPATASQLGLAGGAAVDQVQVPSPASRAGIRQGDVITSFAGQRVTSVASLMLATGNCEPARKVTVDFLQSGMPHTATLVTGTQPAYVSP